MAINCKRKKSLKRRLAVTQDHRCWLCGCRRSVRTFTLDHILPKRLKGTNSLSYLKLACSSCNVSRGNAVGRLLNSKYKLTLDK